MPQSSAKVGGDFSDLVRNAENAAKTIEKVGAALTGIAAASKAFDVATAAIGGTINALGKIGLAAQGLEAIGKSTAAMGMALVKGNAALEMTTISFKTLLGSASAADDMIQKLTQFAASTPFELTGLEASTQKLLAFGYKANDIIPLMTSLGDTISALGGSQENLNSLVYVFGQMHQEAHINAGDIMQMVNQGVPALQLLADHYHKTTAQIQEMISKGLIPGTEAVDIFTKGLEQKYGGMMAAQSSTFNGMLSNLQDWATATTITLSKPFFEPAKKGLAAFLAFVQSPTGVAVINSLAANIQHAVDLATKAFVEFEPHIKPTLDRLLQVAETVRSQFTPGFVSLLPVLEQLYKRLEPVALAAWKVYQAIQPMSIAIAAIKGYATGGLAGALDALKDRFNLVASYAKRGFDLALVEIKKFGPAVLSWVSDTAIDLARQAVTWGESLIEWVAPYAVRLVNELIALGGRVLGWVVDYAPVLAAQALTWAEAIAGWVIPAIPKVLSALVQLGLGVLAYAEKEVPVLVGTMLRWTNAVSGWVLPAIPPLIKALEQLGATVVNWAIGTLPGLIGQVIVGIGQGFGVNLQGPVNDVLLIFNSLVASIGNTVLPAFEQMLSYLAANGQPLFDRLSHFIAGTLIPTFASLAAFAMTVVVPVFVTAADLLGRVFGPSLVLIGSLIRDHLLPALTNLWQKFDSKNLNAVKTLASHLGQDLAGGIGLAVSRFEAALPALESFYQKIEPIAAKAWEVYQAISPLSIALDVLKGFLEGGVQGGLDAFTGHMTKIGDLAQEIIPKLLDGLTTGLPKVFDWIADQAPKILETLGKWGESFGKLVDKVLPPLLNALLKVGEKVLTWIVDKAPDILDKLGEWAGKFGEFAKKAIPILLEKLGDLVKSLTTWLSDHSGEILNTLGEWTGRFVEWGAQLFSKLWPELQKLAGKLWDWIGEKAPELADKVGEWAGALLGWIVTKLIPGYIELFPKVWGAVFKFMGEMTLNIGKEVLKWVGAFLGWIPDVVKQLPGKLWDIITGIGSWVGSVAGNLVQVAGNIGGKIIQGIVQAIHDAPGKIWDAVTGVLGSGAVDIIKGVVKTVANFFVDVVNTPINVLNGIIDTLRNLSIGPFQPFTWLPNLPKLDYLKFAKGTMNAAAGLALVGEQGAELIQSLSGKLMLVPGPTFMNMQGGEKVYNNFQTRNILLPNPASPQQIHNLYQNAAPSYSTINSNNRNTSFNLNANMPVDLQVALNRYYRQQQFLYGR